MALVSASVVANPRCPLLLAWRGSGEISSVDSRPPLATVIALDAARILAVHRDVLHSKLAEDSKFAANFYRALAVFLTDRLRTTTTRLGYRRPEREAAVEAADELGDDLMETASQGTRRFDNLLRRVRNG
jgi:CRP/FNR family transcriptional regulator, cyclic AMP receptor protein